MKRILSVLLCIVMIFSSVVILASCSEEENKEKTEETKETQTKETEKNTEEQKDNTPADGYAMGVRTETGFTSDWMGVKYQLPEGFTMASNEDIAAAMQVGSEYLENPELMDIAQLTSVYEMMASDMYGNNIIIMTEKLTVDMTAEEYAEMVKNQMSVSVTYDVEFGEVTTKEIAGKEYVSLDCNTTIGDYSMVQSYLVRKQGERMVVIAMTSASQEAYDTMLAGFTTN